MPDLTLAEQLLLLAYDDERGRHTLWDATGLDLGLAGGLLVDLAIAGRIEARDDRISVIDTSQTGTPLLDDALARLADEGEPRSAKHWVSKLSGGRLRRRVADALVDRGVLVRDEARVLGLFPRTSYPVADRATEPRVRARLDDVVLRGLDPDAETAALVSLVKAAGLRKAVFPDADRKTVEARMAEVSAGEWAGEAVRKAVQDVQTATMAAMVAVTAASAGGGNG